MLFSRVEVTSLAVLNQAFQFWFVASRSAGNEKGVSMKPGLIFICLVFAISGCMGLSHLFGPAAPIPKSIQLEVVPNNPRIGEKIHVSLADAPIGKHVVSIAKVDDPDIRVFVKEFTTTTATSSFSIALTNPLGKTDKGEDFVLENGVNYLVDVKIQSGNRIRNPAFPFVIRGTSE